MSIRANLLILTTFVVVIFVIGMTGTGAAGLDGDLVKHLENRTDGDRRDGE